MDMEREAAVRRAAFRWLNARLANGLQELPREMLETFEFDGQRLPLVDRNRGIRNPGDFAATLGVLSSADGPYTDESIDGGLIRYAYRSGEGGDNLKLKRAGELGVPIIYFRRTRPGFLLADYPVYVTDVPHARVVLLAIGDEMRFLGDPRLMSEMQHSYAERLIRQRLNQPLFRAQGMHAYANACTICRLKHVDLLDAAHITADSTNEGLPVVTNGLALCKIHHAACDRNLLGVSPDYTVRIRADLLVEVDGPMLKYGLQQTGLRRSQGCGRAWLTARRFG